MGAKPTRYEVLSQVGQGGMGSVFLAHDTELDRKVALKFLTPTHADNDSARRRVMREATAAAQLDHPFICKVYEVGESDEQPFIAMEYVEGTTLKDRIAQGPVPTPEALRLAMETAEALACAQQRGIVHRDLKPANVMLTSDGHVKVMDFGIAKQLAVETLAGDTEPATRTATGTPMGTLAYMSPEQLRSEAVDSRSDIFALGLVLYEMLTGKHPFAGQSAIATATAILHEPAPELARHMSDPPPLLEHIVARMLARDRKERIQTFTDVRVELMSLIGGGTTPAPFRPARRARRTAMVAALLLLTSAFLLWNYSGWFDQPTLAFAERDWILIADADNLTDDPVFDRSLSMALNVAISQSQYVNVYPPSRVREALQRMERPPGQKVDEGIASEVAVREGISAVLSCSIAQVGSVYSLTARLIDPRSQLPVLAETVRADTKDDVLPALDRLASEVRRSLGESLGSLSRQDLTLPQATTASLDALKLYADADGTFDDSMREELLVQALALDPDFALAHARLGMDYYLSSEQAVRQNGEEHIAQALGRLDRLTFRERLWVTAVADDSRGNREQAAVGYRAYLASYPDDSSAWFRLGWTLMAGLQRFEDAIPAFTRAGELSPGNGAAVINLATSYRALHRDQEARDTYERAFAIDPAQLLGDFVNHEYGFLLVRLGDVDAADGVFQKMIEESGPNKRARGLRSLALLNMYRGQYGAAVEPLRQAITIHETNGSQVSEYRDRLFLANVFQAQAQLGARDVEFDRIGRLVSSMALSPSWAAVGVKVLARSGRTRQAHVLLDAMAGLSGDPTTSSSANRNVLQDPAHLNIARGEIELAAGRTAEAIRFFEAAHQVTPGSDTLESLAAAEFAAGREDDAALRYEELIAESDLGSEAQERWFLAHLRLAQIRERQGDRDAARALYEEVVAIWSDADPDLPALREAQDGMARTSTPAAQASGS